MTSSAPIAVAVIGFGSSARTFHLPLVTSLPDLFHLHTIQQRPGSKSGPAVSSIPEYAHVNVAPSFDDVLTNLPKPGLVIITTANETHVPFAKQALLKGYHVVVEKPAALTLKDAQELADIAAKEGLVCSAYQNRRFDGDFLTLQSLLSASPSSGASPLGPALNVTSRFDRFRPLPKGGWREEQSFAQGGGILWDLGAHLVDQALVLFGPPEKVTAFVQSTRNASHPVSDDFLVILSYPISAPLPPDFVAPPAGTRLGGLRVTLGASCMAPWRDDEQLRWRVEGVRGSYEKRGLDPQENQLKAGRKPLNDEAFGSYDEKESDGVKMGRLTTSSVPETDAATAPAGPPQQPILAASDIPTLPGRYLSFYDNVGRTILSVESAGEDKVKRTEAVRSQLNVRPEHVVDSTRLILLADKSAREGRSVEWDESI